MYIEGGISGVESLENIRDIRDTATDNAVASLVVRGARHLFPDEDRYDWTGANGAWVSIDFSQMTVRSDTPESLVELNRLLAAEMMDRALRTLNPVARERLENALLGRPPVASDDPSQPGYVPAEYRS